MVGDGQGTQFNIQTPTSFTGSAGTINFPNLFNGLDGPLWDTSTFNVSSMVGPGNSPGSANIRIAGDCLLWSAQAFSVTSTPVTAPVIATAGVVEAAANGNTVVNLRGLAPTDAPTLQDQIEMIVQRRVIQNPSTSATDLTTQLVNSLPPDILPPNQAANIINAVVKQVVLPPDTIPPTTTATPSPRPNVNGWNNTNVTVALDSVDNPGGSGVKQINIALSGAQMGSVVVAGGTGSVVINVEGATIVTYFGTDNAGNQEKPKTLTVRIDKTPPTAIAIASPGPNANGWNNTTVTVSFSGTDTLSGIASCTGPITLRGEGAGQLASGTCTDNARNVSPPATRIVKIDETAPEASHQFDAMTKTVQVFGRDALSGVPAGPVGGICVPAQSGGDDEDNNRDADSHDGDHHDEPPNAQLCSYTITDLAGNTLVVTERLMQATGDDDHGHELRVRVISTQYKNGPVVAAPHNWTRFQWSSRENGSLKSFDQTMVVGQGKDRREVDAKFDSKKNLTRIRVHDSSQGNKDGDKNNDDDDMGKAIVKPGLALLRMVTRIGLLDIEF
jgi:hypothetical protein